MKYNMDLTRLVLADSVDTYWQSDGAQPHLISIQFFRKMAVREVALYLDFKLDESYTPKKLSIRSGSTVHDLKEVRVEHIVEPTGWVTIPLFDGDENDGEVGSTLVVCKSIYL